MSLSSSLPERILRQLAKRPMLVISSLSLGMKLSKDGLQYKQGKIDASELRQRAGGSVGGIGLGAAGSYAGLVAGHFLMPVPVLGGLLGGFAGGAVGEMLGDRLGRKAVASAEVALNMAPPPKAEDAEGEAKAAAEGEAPAEAPSVASNEAPEPPDPEAPPRRSL